MKLMTPFADPCTCTCHDEISGACPAPRCCYYGTVRRDVAEKLAARACEQHLDGDIVLCVLEIQDHEHNLVTLSNLFEVNDIKTVLKHTDLAADADDRTSKEFMPATRTILECCAPVARVQEMVAGNEELRSIVLVREA